LAARGFCSAAQDKNCAASLPSQQALELPNNLLDSD
jgi:hypothetical protein